MIANIAITTMRTTTEAAAMTDLEVNPVLHLLGQCRLDSAADEERDRQFLEGLQETGHEADRKAACDERNGDSPENA
jgi:hypothetical protein